MGRFGDWEKGVPKESVRVEVAYEVRLNEKMVKGGVVIVVPRSSLNYERDALERVNERLSRGGRAYRILAVRVVDDAEKIH
jgi:hypothetical protein